MTGNGNKQHLPSFWRPPRDWEPVGTRSEGLWFPPKPRPHSRRLAGLRVTPGSADEAWEHYRRTA